MNATDPLSQLHPLREAPAVGWWPPAPGWWLLAALVLLALCWTAWRLWRRYQHRRYRRQALARLAALQHEWHARGDDAATLAAANALLKAAALHAYPAREVASCSGAAWCDFLNDELDARERFTVEALAAPYRPECANIDVDAHLAAARKWLRQHRGRHD